MWPGFGDIDFSVVSSWDFLERVNLINKRLEQERGEKSSSQYSSIGLYHAGIRQPHWYDCSGLSPAHGLELLSYCYKGSICMARWNASLHILVVIAQATAVFCFIGTYSGCFVL